MTHSLIADTRVREAARRLRGDGGLDDAIARAAWSVLTDPGDRVAGALIQQLGPEEALSFALEGPDSGSGPARRALADARRRWRPHADPHAVAVALRSAAEIGARLLVPGDEHWPLSVDDLGEHAPHALWVRGRADLLTASPRVSIVGARASTAYGEHIASEFAGDLAMSGAVIISGGAYGIDGAAHRAALGVEGRTIALLAGGVDRAYPAGHHQLLTQIAAHGTVVSEMPCGAAPTKWRFLSRNRLIAALGHATLVVEAGWRSGSINTAGHAAQLGRPLGAVPGPVTSAASAGSHRILREYDAQCVTTADEVRELWGGAVSQMDNGAVPDPDRMRLLDALSTRTARDVAELARRSKLSAERVRGILGHLELEELVVHTDVGWRSRLSGRT